MRRGNPAQSPGHHPLHRSTISQSTRGLSGFNDPIECSGTKQRPITINSRGQQAHIPPIAPQEPLDGIGTQIKIRGLRERVKVPLQDDRTPLPHGNLNNLARKTHGYTPPRKRLGCKAITGNPLRGLD